LFCFFLYYKHSFLINPHTTHVTSYDNMRKNPILALVEVSVLFSQSQLQPWGPDNFWERHQTRAKGGEGVATGWGWCDSNIIERHNFFSVFFIFVECDKQKHDTIFLLCKIMGILHNTHYILYNTSITICVVSRDNREKAVPKKMRRERERMSEASRNRWKSENYLYYLSEHMVPIPVVTPTPHKSHLFFGHWD
jgi:hypothetical protein